MHITIILYTIAIRAMTSLFVFSMLNAVTKKYSIGTLDIR